MIIGNYLELDKSNERFFHLAINGGDLNSSRARCGLIANFISYYVALNYDNNKNIINSLSTILNELIENAAKYSAIHYDPVDIHIADRKNFLIVEVCNIITEKQLEALKELSPVLIDHEKAHEMYFETIRNSLNNNYSKIGLLMVINYFNVLISLKVSEAIKGDLYRLIMQVKIDIKEL